MHSTPSKNVICPGCGAEFPDSSGPVHPYMTSSAGCWQAYGELLAAEYSNTELMKTHRLSVDTYAVQHPGDDSRRAIQSVGLHLARLMIQIENPLPPRETNNVMLGFARHKASLVFLKRPERFAMTMADVAPLVSGESHTAVVSDWARSTWTDWRDHHDYIRSWVGDLS